MTEWDRRWAIVVRRPGVPVPDWVGRRGARRTVRAWGGRAVGAAIRAFVVVVVGGA